MPSIGEVHLKLFGTVPCRRLRSIPPFAADRTRVLVHATFLNQLDEMYHTSNFSNEEDDDSPMQGSAEPAGSDLALRQR